MTAVPLRRPHARPADPYTSADPRTAPAPDPDQLWTTTGVALRALALWRRRPRPRVDEPAQVKAGRRDG
jgi:hypothetical protein